jgi:hypothetical protein
MADVNARDLRVREAGAVVVGAGSGRKVVDGGEGGLDCDGRVGPPVVITGDGERGACNRKGQRKFGSVQETKLPRKHSKKKRPRGEGENTAVRCSTAWDLLARRNYSSFFGCIHDISQPRCPIQLETVTYFLCGSGFSPEVQVVETRSLYTWRRRVCWAAKLIGTFPSKRLRTGQGN